MAKRDEASLCWELTQPNALRIVNMACTRSTEVWNHKWGKKKMKFCSVWAEILTCFCFFFSPLTFSPDVPACLRRACVNVWHAVVLPVPLRPTAHTLWSLRVPTRDTYTRLTKAAMAGGASHTDSPRRDFGVWKERQRQKICEIFGQMRYFTSSKRSDASVLTDCWKKPHSGNVYVLSL